MIIETLNKRFSFLKLRENVHNCYKSNILGLFFLVIFLLLFISLYRISSVTAFLKRLNLIYFVFALKSVLQVIEFIMFCNTMLKEQPSVHEFVNAICFSLILLIVLEYFLYKTTRPLHKVTNAKITYYALFMAPILLYFSTMVRHLFPKSFYSIALDLEIQLGILIAFNLVCKNFEEWKVKHSDFIFKIYQINESSKCKKIDSLDNLVTDKFCKELEGYNEKLVRVKNFKVQTNEVINDYVIRIEALMECINEFQERAYAKFCAAHSALIQLNDNYKEILEKAKVDPVIRMYRKSLFLNECYFDVDFQKFSDNYNQLDKIIDEYEKFRRLITEKVKEGNQLINDLRIMYPDDQSKESGADDEYSYDNSGVYES